LGGKFPFLVVQLSDGAEPSIDLGLPMMRAIIPIEKLARIGYLVFPDLPTAEALCTRRPPEDRGWPAGDWAYEVPLVNTEPSWLSRKQNKLIESTLQFQNDVSLKSAEISADATSPQ
jgi:hypothetical protein